MRKYFRDPSLLVKKTFFILFIIASAVTLSSCAFVKKNNYGYMPAPKFITIVKPQVHTKQDVVNILGTPGIGSSFDNNKWYYVLTETQNIGSLGNSLKDQHTIVLEFDENDVVQNITEIGIEESFIIPPNRNETSTFGRTTGFFDKMHQNLFKNFNLGT